MPRVPTTSGGGTTITARTRPTTSAPESRKMNPAAETLAGGVAGGKMNRRRAVGGAVEGTPAGTAAGTRTTAGQEADATSGAAAAAAAVARLLEAGASLILSSICLSH